MLHLSRTHKAQRMIVALQRAGMTLEAKEALLDRATVIAQARGSKMIGKAALEQALDELGGEEASATGSGNPGGGFLPVAGAEAPTSFSSLSTLGGSAGLPPAQDLLIPSAHVLSVTPICTIYPSGRVEVY